MTTPSADRRRARPALTLVPVTDTSVTPPARSPIRLDTLVRVPDRRTIRSLRK